MKYKIHLDKSTHTYYVNDLKKASVTQILQSAGYDFFKGIPPDVLEKRKILGSMVHEMTELYDLGNLDEKDLSDELKPYLECWKKFLADMGVKKFILIERPLYSFKHDYCGTPDRVIDRDDCWWLPDIKIGSLTKAWRIQLYAYEQLIKENFPVYKVMKPFIIKLDPDLKDKYKPYYLPRKNAFTVFQSAHNIYKDKEGK